MEVVRPVLGGSGGGVGRAGDGLNGGKETTGARGLGDSSPGCVRGEDEEDNDELDEAASGAASEDVSEDAGFFQRRYTLWMAGFLTFVSGEGDGGSGATYPMDITSPRWLAWMPGMVIIFACGCWWMGDGEGDSGGCCSVFVRDIDGDGRFCWRVLPLLLLPLLFSAVAARAMSVEDASLDKLFCEGRLGCMVTARSRLDSGIGIGIEDDVRSELPSDPRSRPRRSATAALTSA
jgi:hypothetical protein